MWAPGCMYNQLTAARYRTFSPRPLSSALNVHWTQGSYGVVWLSSPLSTERVNLLCRDCNMCCMAL